MGTAAVFPAAEQVPLRFLHASEAGRVVVTPTNAFAPIQFEADERALDYLRASIARINTHLSSGTALAKEDEQLLTEMVAKQGVDPLADVAGCNSGGCSCSISATRKSVELFLLLAQFCNLGCVYCLDGSESYQTSRRLKMSPEVAILAVDRIVRTLRPGDRLTVTFFGGEPLLNWQTAREVIEHAKNVCLSRLVDLQFSVQTNLTFLPPGFIEDVKRECVVINCSIDGPESVHNALRPHRNKSGNSFKMTESRLRELRENDIAFNLRATITSLNVDILPEIADLHMSLGAGGTVFGMLRPVNSDGFVFDDSLAPDLNILADSFRRLHTCRPEILDEVSKGILSRMRMEDGNRACGAAYMATPTVDSNGDVYSCAWFVGQPDKLIGNVEDASFMRDDAVLKNYAQFDGQLDPICAACDYYAVCKGGCAATRLASGTGPEAKHAVDIMRGQQCTLVKTVVEHLLLEGAPKG